MRFERQLGRGMVEESALDHPTRPNVTRPIPILMCRIRSDFGIKMATIRSRNDMFKRAHRD
jgi:hypothetical protein